MRIKFSLLIAAVLLIVMPATASAADRYISTTGSDSNACLLTAPCKTWAHVSPLLTPGDTLYMRGGTYTGTNSAGLGEADWKAPSGTSTAPITLRNYPGETVVMDGGFNSCCALEFTSGQSYQVIQGIRFTRYDSYYGDGAIVLSNGSHLTFRQIQLDHNGNLWSGKANNGGPQNDHNFYINGGITDVTVEQSKIMDSGGGGMHFFHSGAYARFYIRNNLFVNNFWGVIAGTGGHDIYITNNTFFKSRPESSFNPASAAITNASGSPQGSTMIIRNNVVKYDTNGLIVSNTGTYPVVEDHNIWNAPTPVTGITKSSTDTTSDPLFVSPPDDLHLQVSSPAIDAGTATGAPSTDLDGNARPQGNGYDIGAYEANATPPPPPPPSETVVPDDGDTYIDQAFPTANYVSAPLLTTYGDPTNVCYGSCGRMLLEFNPVPANVGTVKLRLYMSAASSDPVSVRAIVQGCSIAWSSVNWQTRPDQGAVLATLPSVVAGWNEWTLPASSVPAAGGPACFYVTKSGSAKAQANSNNSANAPQLVVQ